ncbi:MAG: phosphoribosyltransferase [bacterium]|nr:MAG: phosphoribosyltransferase [bacterium]KAF0147888.1 MAG: phosphoribosyltransferase [bacterium]KAF0167489.1 MAG: phosphoribosyltransferase [bacterium]TXT20975.1 MAG: phosphoribosyltransferase [bacterium]
MLSNRLVSILNNCINSVQSGLPQACLLCGARTLDGLLCAGCVADLPALSRDCCPRCALPMSGAQAEGEVCGRCLRHPPAFELTRAVFRFAFPLDALIRHCKYHGALELTDWFARVVEHAVADLPRPDLLLPMPLHPARLAERGFNQAAEIARRLAPRLDIPWSATGARRLRDTPPQAGLDLRARRGNLRGAFRCDLDLSGRHVVLLDDVMTSGASLQELAQATRQAGAARVSAWVVARAV